MTETDSSDHLKELEEQVKFLPALPMDITSRHIRDDHRECPTTCIKWGYDLRPVPVFMEVWLEHPASSIT